MLATKIQDNLKDYILFMTQQGDYEMHCFDEIVMSYTGLGFYNFIFAYTQEQSPFDNLQKILDYANNKHSFMLIKTKKYNPDLHQFLNKNKFNLLGSATLMAVPHAEFKMQQMDDIEIQRVDNHDLLKQFCLVHDESFGMPAGVSSEWFSRMPNLFEVDFQARLYVAVINIDGEPKVVGAAVLYLPPDTQKLAGHYAWSVKPEYRNKGIMTFLVKTMIQIAKDEGYKYSVAQCYDASVHLAQHIGFKKYGMLELFNN